MAKKNSYSDFKTALHEYFDINDFSFEDKLEFIEDVVSEDIDLSCFLANDYLHFFSQDDLEIYSATYLGDLYLDRCKEIYSLIEKWDGKDIFELKAWIEQLSSFISDCCFMSCIPQSCREEISTYQPKIVALITPNTHLSKNQLFIFKKLSEDCSIAAMDVDNDCLVGIYPKFKVKTFTSIIEHYLY